MSGSTPPPKSPDDALARAAAGDGEAWRDVVAHWTPRVFALLLKQCRDRELAEELTQATFVKVVTRIERYRERGRFEAWLFRVAMNHLRDEMRRRRRQATPVDPTGGDDAEGARTPRLGDAGRNVRGETAEQPSPLDRMALEEDLVRLRDAVGRLPEADQEVLLLRHTAGLSFAQIAESLGQPLGTVLARGHRALGKLRKMLADADADADGQVVAGGQAAPSRRGARARRTRRSGTG